MFKWLKDIPHLEIKAFPGLNLTTAFLELVNGRARVEGYDGVIISCGTNEIPYSDKATIVQKMCAIINYLKHAFRQIKIAITMILPRPADQNEADHIKLHEVNNLLRALCKRERITFMKSVKGISTNWQVDLRNFAFDKLHLNRRGIMNMRRYMIGATANFVGR